MTIIRVNNSNPCPICSSNKSCGFDNTSQLYFCLRNQQDTGGFTFLKTSADGTWGIFKGESNGQEVPVARRTTNGNRAKHVVSRGRLNDLYRALVSELTLNAHNVADLVKRGLTEEQCASLDFYSIRYGYKTKVKGSEAIPGFDGDTWKGATGLLLPCYDLTGVINGFQIRPHRIVNNCKYLWCSYKEDDITVNSSRFNVKGNIDELPLNVVNGGQEGLSTIYFCEGILKSTITAFRHSLFVVGASGGNFLAARNQVQEILTKSDANEVVFLADSGSSVNPDVLNRLSKTKDLVESFGINFRVADWGQLNAKVDGMDCDEIDTFTLETAIHIKEEDTLNVVEKAQVAQAILELADEVLTTPDTKGVDRSLIQNTITHWFDTDNTTIPMSHHFDPVILGYKPEDHQFLIDAAASKGYKYILDVSPAGSSKSYVSGLYKPERSDEFDRAIYLSSQSRLPSTTTLEDNYYEYPTKNYQLFVDPHQKTTRGRDYLRRERVAGSVRIVPGNCFQANDQIRLSSLGSSINLCKTCPMFDACKKGESEGEYGYLFQVKKAYAHDRFRCNPLQIGKAMFKTDTLLIIDEWSRTIPQTRELTIDLNDLKQMPLIEDLLCKKFPLLNAVKDLLSGKKQMKAFGLSKSEFQSQYGCDYGMTMYAEQIANWQNERNIGLSASGLSEKEFWSPLFRALAGMDNHISFFIDNGKMTIVERYHDFFDRMNEAKTVVFLDATSTVDSLAKTLMVGVESILVISQAHKPVKHVKIRQCVALGGLGCQRSEGIQEKVSIAKDALKKVDPKIGFIDYGRFARSSDDNLMHFVGARGSNFFERKKTIAIFGSANTNVSACRAMYEVMSNAVVSDSDRAICYDFRVYYETLIQAEMEQEIGRLRAVRRLNEDLTCYVFSTVNLRFLQQKGYQLEFILGSDIDERVASNKDKLIRGIQKLDVDWQHLSSRKLAEAADTSYHTITNLIKRDYKSRGGFDQLKEDLLKLVHLCPEILLIAVKAKYDEQGMLAFDYFKQLFNFFAKEQYRFLNKEEKDYSKNDKYETQRLINLSQHALF